MTRRSYIVLLFLLPTLVGCRFTDNAQANYEQGKQLRLDGHYPEAMTCFLDAVHSHTRDNIVLGRVWSNIADICQLEGNYVLAYDMHVRSSECFRKANDSVHYYYALNNQAIQRALQQEKPATYVLLHQIESECTDSAVLTKTLETKALVCLNVEEYDSAVYYVNCLRARGYDEITGALIKAQAFAGMQQADSAVAYAEEIAPRAQTYSELNNCYYILTHFDQHLDTAAIRDIAIRRAGVQRAQRMQQGELTRAVEMLENDLSRSQACRWPLMLLMLFVAAVGVLFFVRLRKSSQQLQQHRQTAQGQLDETCRYLCACPDLRSELQWTDYNAMCNTVNIRLFGLVDKLQRLNVMNENDIRLCVLVFIGLSHKQIAEVLYYSHKSIGRIKEITANKLGVHGGELYDYLHKLVLKTNI